ncbi:MAG: aldehyde dehydrogenase, partial [Actinomycetales bacterium]
MTIIDSTLDADVLRAGMLIDGEEVFTDDVIEVRNPATGAVVATIPRGDATHVDHAVGSAAVAFDRGVWANKTMHERVAVIRRLAELVGDANEELVVLETLGNGATVRQATGFHIGYVAPHLEYFADLGLRFEADRPAPMTSFPSLGQASVRK